MPRTVSILNTMSKQDIEARLTEFFLEGKTFNDFASSFGITRAQAHNIMSRNNIKPSALRAELIEKYTPDVIEDWSSHSTDSADDLVARYPLFYRAELTAIRLNSDLRNKTSHGARLQHELDNPVTITAPDIEKVKAAVQRVAGLKRLEGVRITRNVYEANRRKSDPELPSNLVAAYGLSWAELLDSLGIETNLATLRYTEESKQSAFERWISEVDNYSIRSYDKWYKKDGNAPSTSIMREFKPNWRMSVEEILNERAHAA